MKKCASCTKDLPDAALHCVFCGAKQPPAPAVQQGLAKTAFGYSANDLLDQAKQQGASPARSAPNPPARSAPNSPPSPANNPPPTPSFPPPAAPSYNPPPAAAYNPPAPFNAPPAFSPPPAFNAPPAFNPPPTFNARPAFNASPTFNAPPAPPFRPPPAFNAPPASNPPPAPSFTPPPAPSYSPPPAAAYSPPMPFNTPRPAAPPAASPYSPPQGYPPAASPPPAGFVPASAANAATMFVQTGPSGPASAQNATVQVGPAPASLGRPSPAAQQMPATLVPPPPQQQVPAPQPPQVPALRMPIPASQPPPYLASHTASRLARPLEPWKDSLRLMMFLWGAALLVVFAMPLTSSPLAFNWNLILNGEGTARLPPLTFASVGLLSAIIAGIPMQPAARGLIAAVLGLAGIVVPIALVGVPSWQTLSSMIGTLVLVPGLFVRNEYRGPLVPRLLVTLGAIGILLPFVLPQGGAIPLVALFKALIDVPGSAKVGPALALGEITVVVMSLLAWLPAPVTGAAKLWAWLLILWGLIDHVILLIFAGHLGDAITGAPNAALVSWIAGGPSPSSVALGAAYLVLVGYGLASVVGKQLE